MEDDPQRRKPDISTAKNVLNWQPTTKLIDGIKKTVGYFRKELNKNRNGKANQTLTEMHKSYFYTASEEEKLKEKNYKIEL